MSFRAICNHHDVFAGLSRLANAGSSKALAGNGLGTIAYTAPETFQNGVADMSSDVYAFGILGDPELSV